MKKVSMDMVAKKLGVSKALVSLALNDKYGVSAKMRFLIYKCAIELGYDFNYKYKNRNDSREKKISFFIKKEEIVSNDYWSELFAGAEKILNEDNFNTTFEFWSTDDNPMEILMHVASTHPLGIIIVNEVPFKLFDGLKKMDIPIMLVDGKYYEDRDFDNVRTNNYLGGQLVAEYLCSSNFKNVSFIGDKDHSISFRERYYGFKNYFEERKDINFSYKTLNPFEVYPSSSEAIELEKYLINLKMPCALFCANDDIAVFIYSILEKHNIKIPSDISIVGFDDLPAGKSLKPPLTTVKVPIKEIGEVAVKGILERIKHKEQPKKVTLLSVSIIKRNSVSQL